MTKSRFDIFNFFKEAYGIRLITAKARLYIVAGLLLFKKHSNNEEYIIAYEKFKPLKKFVYQYINDDLNIRIFLKKYCCNLIITERAEELLKFKLYKKRNKLFGKLYK